MRADKDSIAPQDEAFVRDFIENLVQLSGLDREQILDQWQEVFSERDELIESVETASTLEEVEDALLEREEMLDFEIFWLRHVLEAASRLEKSKAEMDVAAHRLGRLRYLRERAYMARESRHRRESERAESEGHRSAISGGTRSIRHPGLRAYPQEGDLTLQDADEIMEQIDWHMAKIEDMFSIERIKEQIATPRATEELARSAGRGRAAVLRASGSALRRMLLVYRLRRKTRWLRRWGILWWWGFFALTFAVGRALSLLVGPIPIHSGAPAILYWTLLSLLVGSVYWLAKRHVLSPWLERQLLKKRRSDLISTVYDFYKGVHRAKMTLQLHHQYLSDGMQGYAGISPRPVGGQEQPTWQYTPVNTKGPEPQER